MNGFNDIISTIDQQISLLYNEAEMSSDQYLELADQISDKGRTLADKVEKSEEYAKSAEVCEKIAGAWRFVISKLSEDRRSFFQPIAQYWEDRAAVMRNQGKDKKLTVPDSPVSPPTPVPDFSLQNARQSAPVKVQSPEETKVSIKREVISPQRLTKTDKTSFRR